MSFDDIIILVKETIDRHGDIFQNDEIILDSNAVDHIADDIATALCGARDEHADVEPVRHGHWILTQQISENAFRYNCSKCNRWVQDGAGKNPSDRFPYSHCGAKMDAKENEK